jgi:hypothetical protein
MGTTTGKPLVNAPPRQQMTGAATRENPTMVELLGPRSHADAQSAF